MKNITPLTNIETDAGEPNSSGRGKQSFCEPLKPTPSLFGESSSTTADSRESIAPCSETKARIDQATLSDRLTESLISAGLVKGIIPTSIRKRSNPLIPAIALWLRDGGDADEPKAGY
jgi:hypothetical protein